MQRKRILLMAFIMSIFFLCFLVIISVYWRIKETKAVLPEDKKIDMILVDGIKIYANESSKWADFEEFKQSFENLIPLGKSKEKDICRGKTYYVIILEYDDQTRETYFFFQDAGEWYVETENKRIFRNAGFITQYINLPPEISSNPIELEATWELQEQPEMAEIIELSLCLKELGVSFATDDLRAIFALEIKKQSNVYNLEQQEIVRSVREKIKLEMSQYQYAVQKGLAIPDEELDKRMAEQDAIIKSAKNFSEFECYFEEYGITYDEYRNNIREYNRIQLTIQKLYQEIREEFRYGNDRIGEKICEDSNEYMTYYLCDIVYPSTESYREEVVEPLLDEAEAFYYEVLLSET